MALFDHQAHKLDQGLMMLGLIIRKLGRVERALADVGVHMADDATEVQQLLDLATQNHDDVIRILTDLHNAESGQLSPDSEAKLVSAIQALQGAQAAIADASTGDPSKSDASQPLASDAGAHEVLDANSTGTGTDNVAETPAAPVQ